MTARPILFSGPMVRALLEGRKTQTRRVVKNAEKMPTDPENYEHNGWAFCREYNGGDFSWPFPCPYGEPGDLLWVRETWQLHSRATDFAKVVYRASEAASHTEFHELIPISLIGEMQPKPFQEGWRSSIHMPRWASRLTLELTEVRVERLQDISEADAVAEGCSVGWLGDAIPETNIGGGLTISSPGTYASAAGKYQILWDEINGEGSWDIDPWVWVLEFRVHRQNVDALLKTRAA